MASTTIKTFRTTPKRLTCSEVFFKCLEVFSGDGWGTLRDSIRGCVYNPILGNHGQFYDIETGDNPAGVPVDQAVWMRNGTTPVNSVYPLNLTPVALESGSWPHLQRRKVIIFGCGTVEYIGYARIPFGNGGAVMPGSDGNISVSCGGTLHGLVRGPDGSLLDITGQTFLHCDALALQGKHIAMIGEHTPATESGNGSFHYKLIFDDGSIPLDELEINPLEMLTPVTVQEDCTPHLNNFTRFGGLNFYGIRMFSFNGDLPPEPIREAAYKWMMRHYAAGHREEPPHFYGYD